MVVPRHCFISMYPLIQKKHNFELQPSNYTVLCVDYAQSGIGSNSCAPELLEQYRLGYKEFEFGMKLMTYTK